MREREEQKSDVKERRKPEVRYKCSVGKETGITCEGKKKKKPEEAEKQLHVRMVRREQLD